MSFRRPLLAILPFWCFIFFFKFAGSLHYTFLPILGEQVFPLWLTGLLIGGAAGLQMLADVPAGFLLDRFGYIRSLKVTTGCFLLGCLVLALGVTPSTVILSIILATIGWLFFTPGMDAYVLAHAERKLAGRFMSTRDVVASGGVVISMLILPLLIKAPTYTLPLLLSVGFSMSIIALFRSPLDTASVHTEKKISHQSFYIRRHFFHHVLKAITKLNPVSSALLLQQFCAANFYGILWFVIPLMITHSAHAGILSFGLVVFDLSTLLLGFFLGRLSDRYSKRWLVFWGLLLFSVGALLTGMYFDILFIIFGFLAATGDEMSSVSLWAWLDHLDKDHSEDGLISGVMTLFEDLGWTTGPIMAGFLYHLIGPTWTIAVGASFIFLTWIISTILFHSSKMPRFAVLISRLEHTERVPRRFPHKS